MPTPLFQKGNKIGATGRPKGSRSVILKALDEIGSKESEAVLSKVTAAAKAGDMRAAEILLARIWPPRKSRPIEGLSLPALKTSKDLVEAHARVVAGVADGIVSPEEAQSIAAVLDSWRKASELMSIEERLQRLENAMTIEGKVEP